MFNPIGNLFVSLDNINKNIWAGVEVTTNRLNETTKSFQSEISTGIDSTIKTYFILFVFVAIILIVITLIYLSIIGRR